MRRLLSTTLILAVPGVVWSAGAERLTPIQKNTEPSAVAVAETGIAGIAGTAGVPQAIRVAGTAGRPSAGGAAPRNATGAAGACDTTTVRLPEPDGLGAGLIYWATLSAMAEAVRVPAALGEKRQVHDNYGVAIRLNVGPLISDQLALPIQLGYSGAVDVNHVELGLLPTFWFDEAKAWQLSGLVGAAGSQYSGALCPKDTRCATRFQYMAGFEGAWFPPTTKVRLSNDLTEIALTEISERVDDYRRQCAPPSKASDSPCQKLVREINVRAQALARPETARRQCKIPKAPTTDASGTLYYSEDQLVELELCQWGLRQQVPAASSLDFGFVLHGSYVGGRDLPSALRLDAGIGLRF